jgi:hypothetical protein
MILFSVFFCYSCLLPLSANAIPSLGVAPGLPGDQGIYLGPHEDYLAVFADNFLGTGDGFAAPASGGQLSIWYGSNNGKKLREDVTVWLLTNAAAGDDFAYRGQDFRPTTFNSVGPYKKPLYGIDIRFGEIDDPGAEWSQLTEGPFDSGKKLFFYVTGVIEYPALNLGEWLFAYIPPNSPKGEFSPPTTSVTAVPIPGTLWLFGNGLVGLVAIRTKRRY